MSKSEAFMFIPKLIIQVPDYKDFEIDGMSTPGAIMEINFYSRLNSFSFNADITIDDMDNTVLNRVINGHGVKAIINLYVDPDKIEQPYQEVTKNNAVKVFQKAFVVSGVKVEKFGVEQPNNSKIKLILTDPLETDVLDKILHYSNFHLNWDSDEMTPEPTFHKILSLYELFTDKIKINPELFGVDKNSLKRRFVTDPGSSIMDVFTGYIDALYNTRWVEFLSEQPKMEIPNCVLAYTNLYYVDDNGLLRRKPWLTSANILDVRPDNCIYGIPYPSGILKKNGFTKREYDLYVDDMDIDLRGAAGPDIKRNVLASSYRKFSFSPKNGLFNDKIRTIGKIPAICTKIKSDIESLQVPKYIGTGPDPKFQQLEYQDEKMYLKYPDNVKETKYYSSDGTKSFYDELYSLVSKPIVYVSIPYSAWHSPGQELDLRINAMLKADDVEIEKSRFFSISKLVSGRWKILSTVTNLTSDNFGLKPTETFGLSRPRYLHGENKEIK